MRAHQPDTVGTVVRDGVTLGYEGFGDGDPAILLLPTWTIIHSRFWKMQVPYLARRHRVITYDGPGNGGSDRITDPARYSPDAYAADAKAVLDECDIKRAIVVGLSMGAQYGIRLAALHPEVVSGLVMIGPALPLSPPSPERASVVQNFAKPYPEDPQGWDKYNLAYWHDHYADFTRFFFGECFPEPHSTKPREDSVGWAAETGPAVLEAEAHRPAVDTRRSTNPTDRETDVVAHWSDQLTELSCPVMVVHGTDDRIIPYETGAEVARLTDGTLATMEGSGHLPNVRDPVRFNLVLRDFIEAVEA